MALGALGVSAPSIFIGLSGTSPGTATFFRCVLALPLLWPLAPGERRREGGPSRRRVLVAVAAGLLFAGDALLWTQAIYEIGAGLSTVLVNAQVIIVQQPQRAGPSSRLAMIYGEQLKAASAQSA